MAVTLVAHVKDDPVPLWGKNTVEGHSELHGPQIGRQMASLTGDHLHQTFPELGTEGLSLAVGHKMQIVGNVQQSGRPPFTV